MVGNGDGKEYGGDGVIDGLLGAQNNRHGKKPDHGGKKKQKPVAGYPKDEFCSYCHTPTLLRPAGVHNQSGVVSPEWKTITIKTMNKKRWLFIYRLRISENLNTGQTDYSLFFSVCQDIGGYFFHVQTLADKLKTALEPPYDREDEYQTGGMAYRTLEKTVAIEIPAREKLGTVGGSKNVAAFDFGLTDFRISPLNAANPTRWSPGVMRTNLNSCTPSAPLTILPAT